MNNILENHTFLLAFDLDGTLLTSNKTIGEKTKALLKELASKGNKIVLASGRPLRSVKQYAEELSISGPYIGYNGAMIAPGNTSFPPFEKKIKKEVFNSFYSRFKDDIDNFMTEDLTDQYYKKENKDYVSFFHPEGMKVHLGEDYLPIQKDLNTVVVRTNSSLHHPDMQDYLHTLDSNLALRFWFHEPLFCEFYFLDTDKATAIDRVRKYYGIDRAHSIAFGDAYNDLEMIKSAGISVAMKNGAPKLQQAADYVTPEDNDHEGIYWMLKKLFNE
ncbi:MAG: Cof-type HAD-IIB family hydrolase [Eubacteriales bacterium]|nr:Cof-type HAD-IIB family hydrolase [Eubacteriales bacterium]